MAKKQIQSKTLPQVDVVGEKTNNGYQYINSLDPKKVGMPNYTSGHLQPIVNPWVREKAKEFDIFTEMMEGFDKGSDEYMGADKGREEVATSLIALREQLDKYNAGTMKLMEVLGSMSKGTQDANLYTNMLVFGAQSDGASFDEKGKLSFGSVYGKGPDDISTFKLDDMSDPTSGGSPIIPEPYETKTYIWNLAEETHQKKEKGEEFDYDWAYKRLMNDLTERGSSNTIGLAFADLAGDNESKSFAEQYEDGLADPIYYINPETGEKFPPGNGWMKDTQYADILKKFLGKYVIDIMKDVYGIVDEETGQIKKSQADIAQEIVKKYSK